jgi:hypothetical protein
MDSTLKYYGVYRGVVKDNRDPDNQRRLKVTVSQLTGTEVTDWAWPIEPSSIHTGVPGIGQGVWVSYIGGDPDYPVWVGSFGTNQGANKQIFVKPLADSTSIVGITDTIIVNSKTDSTKELDLIDTVIALANKLKNHETRIASLESQLTTLHNTLGTRTAPSHTHGSNG